MDTQWERSGFGLWRRSGTAMLRVLSSRGNMRGEVLVTEKDGTVVSIFSSQMEDEEAVIEWCERWALAVQREVEKD